MTHARKTRNKNQKKRRRKSKNLFWLVWRRNGFLVLYSRKPYIYNGDWFSLSSECYPNCEVAKNINVGFLTPVPVKLIICATDPDMYIQRYKDCLFISRYVQTAYIGGRPDKMIKEVPHGFRISSKLFPDVTEESGIVGVKIVNI